MKLKIGLSPCPNDTFIFHALLGGLLPDLPDLELEPEFFDVERLNQYALERRFEITKISIGVVPYILKDYKLLSSGGALGFGCGPLLVGRPGLGLDDLRDEPIAVPGLHTTANLLLDFHGGFNGPRREYLFSDIMPAINRGEIGAGIIIHEGRFTYGDYNLQKILDTGEWWENKFGLPLPLGAIAIRRDVDESVARILEEAISKSVEYAWQNPDASKEFVKSHAQEMGEDVTRAHIDTFVTQYSRGLGESGQDAIKRMLAKVCGAEDIFL